MPRLHIQLIFLKPGVVIAECFNGPAIALGGAINGHEPIVGLTGFSFSLKAYSDHESSLL